MKTRIIKFIVNYLNRFIPHQEIAPQREKEYSKAKVHSVIRRLERLQVDIKEKGITCSLYVSTEPSVCILPTRYFSNKSDFLNPKKNANIFVRFYFANGVNEPLLNFWVGTDKCVLESVRRISKEERSLLKKAMPFSFIEKDPDQALLLFLKKINIMIDIKERKEKYQEIFLKENKRDILQEKLKHENSEAVLNELMIVKNALKKLKDEFNDKFGLVCFVD